MAIRSNKQSHKHKNWKHRQGFKEGPLIEGIKPVKTRKEAADQGHSRRVPTAYKEQAQSQIVQNEVEA